jgi:hypothetical protein
LPVSRADTRNYRQTHGLNVQGLIGINRLQERKNGNATYFIRLKFARTLWNIPLSSDA